MLDHHHDSFSQELTSNMKCHYEVLGTDRDADDTTIKVAYAKLAVRWQSDKKLENIEEAKNRFQLVQQAYEVLSDSQERAWYDFHREQILRGSKSHSDESLGVFQYFTASCYRGFDDSKTGFYSVYCEVFEKLSAEDMEFMDSDDKMFIPGFGNSSSSYEEVVGPFYSYWQNYCTKKSYAWLCPEIRDRMISRHVETGTQNISSKARKVRNDEVRALVAFVKKRDRRVLEYSRMLEELAKINRSKRLDQLRINREEVEEAMRLQKKHGLGGSTHGSDSVVEAKSVTVADKEKLELVTVKLEKNECFNEDGPCRNRKRSKSSTSSSSCRRSSCGRSSTGKASSCSKSSTSSSSCRSRRRSRHRSSPGKAGSSRSKGQRSRYAKYRSFSRSPKQSSRRRSVLVEPERSRRATSKKPEKAPYFLDKTREYYRKKHLYGSSGLKSPPDTPSRNDSVERRSDQKRDKSHDSPNRQKKRTSKRRSPSTQDRNPNTRDKRERSRSRDANAVYQRPDVNFDIMYRTPHPHMQPSYLPYNIYQNPIFAPRPFPPPNHFLSFYPPPRFGPPYRNRQPGPPRGVFTYRPLRFGPPY